MTVLTVLTSAVVYLLLLLAGLWCWIQWRHRRLIQAAANIHCLFPTLPFIGNLHYFLLGTDKLTSMYLDKVHELYIRRIFSYSFWLGPYPLISIIGEQDIETVLTSSKCMEKGTEMETFEIGFKIGLIGAPANTWKITRRAIDPVFHPRNLSLMMPTFNSNSRDFVAKLAEYERKGPVDVFPHTMVYSIKSVYNLIFGPDLEFNATSENLHELIYVIERVTILLPVKIFFHMVHCTGLFRFIYREELKTVEACLSSLAKTALKVRRKNNTNYELRERHINKDVASEGPDSLVNVYSNLQNSNPVFTEDDLKSEMITFFTAGTDSVTTIVSSCLLLLAYHKDIQDKLFKEILSIVDLERDITDDDIRQMTYLDQVFKETLRWSYVVPLILRQPSEDLTLSDCTIPAGYTIFLGIGGPLIDSKTYPNPKGFDPDRFSPENSKHRRRFAFIPFSRGPRNCIGKAYSNLLVKTMVIQVLRKFKLSTTMDIYSMKRTWHIFLMSSEGYKLSLEPRMKHTTNDSLNC